MLAKVWVKFLKRGKFIKKLKVCRVLDIKPKLYKKSIYHPNVDHSREGSYWHVRFTEIPLGIRGVTYMGDNEYLIPGEDVFIPNYSPGRTNNSKLQNIRSFFNDLIIRKCGNVVYENNYNEFTKQENKKLGENFKIEDVMGSPIPIEKIKKIKVGYVYYYGFTKPYTNGSKVDHGLYFHRRNKKEISFEPKNIGRWVKCQDNKIPKDNQIICGTVSVDEGVLKFTRWFMCSPQFYRLIVLVNHGENHLMFRGKSQTQILRMLETNPSRKIIGAPVIHSQEEYSTFLASVNTEDKQAQKRAEYAKSQLQYLKFESAAHKYCDVYKAIAQVFVFNEKVPLNYYLPEDGPVYECRLNNMFG